MSRFIEKHWWSGRGWKPVMSLVLVGGLVASCKKTEKSEPETKREPEVKDAPVVLVEEGGSDWPVTRGGDGLSGQAEGKVIRNPVVRWEFQTDAPIAGEAIVSSDVVVFGNDKGELHALDLRTGKLKWKKEFEDGLEAAPAIYGDTLYVGCQDSFLYALDLVSGEEKWKVETNDKITAGVNLTMSPDGATPWVVLNGYDGACRVLDATSGKQIWIYQTDEYINGTPAIVDGKWIVFGGCDRVLYTLNLADGTPAKTIDTDAEIVSTVATEGSFVAWGNYGNEVLGAEVESGTVSWTYRDRQFPFMSAPAIDGERVYAGCRDKKIHAISRKTGKSVWKYKTGGRVESSPILFEDAVVCGSNDGRLYALTLEKGELIWRIDLGESIIAAPSFSKGLILIGSEDGTLFALGAGEEKLKSGE